MTVVHFHTECFHRCTGFTGSGRHTGEHCPERCTCLRCLDTAVRHQPRRNRSIFHRIAKRTGKRCRIFERFAHHFDVHVGIGCCRCHDIRKASCIFGRFSERRERIRHNVGCCSKLRTGSRCQIHHAVNAVQHVLGFPSCHCHVTHRIGSFGRREFGCCAHLFGFFGELVHLFGSRARNRLHFAHGAVKRLACFNHALDEISQPLYGFGDDLRCQIPQRDSEGFQTAVCGLFKLPVRITNGFSGFLHRLVERIGGFFRIIENCLIGFQFTRQR